MFTCYLWVHLLLLFIVVDYSGHLFCQSSKKVFRHNKDLVRHKNNTYHAANYRWVYKLIDNSERSNISLIFEVGSRDLLDANQLAEHFDATVFAFEGSPDNHKLMERHNDDPRVQMVRSVVSTVDGPVTFHPFNLSLYSNRGASSLFMIDFASRDPRDKDFNRSAVQYSAAVPSTRLDTFMTKIGASHLDLLCMDVQEAELEVVKSLGSMISQVQFIVSEVSTASTYIGGSNFSALHDYLTAHGFAYVAGKQPSSRMHFRELPDVSRRMELDVFYQNKNLVA